MSAAAGVLIFVSLSAFCGLVGYRLLFNRPNRNGSLLSPTGWMWLALCFWVIGLTMAAVSLGRADYTLLLGTLGAGVLGFWCVRAGRFGSRKAALSPVFPPGTSLLQVEGFTPAEFSCGIELMNDNLTPMAFVVSVLRSCVGLSEAEAIRTMLEIHKKGGILLPTPSFDEAKRVAELVTVEARGSNHPLVCRGVKLG